MMADDPLDALLSHVEGSKRLTDGDLTTLMQRYGLLEGEDRVCDELAERGWVHCLTEGDAGEWWHGGTGEILVLVVLTFRRGRRTLARFGEVGSVYEEPDGDKLVGLHREGKRRRRLLPGRYLKVLARY
jgi:hypothetical protein